MINLHVFTLIILAAAISGVLTPAARATLIIFNNRTAFNSAGPGLNGRDIRKQPPAE
jgi:hypothetical protein